MPCNKGPCSGHQASSGWGARRGACSTASPLPRPKPGHLHTPLGSGGSPQAHHTSAEGSSFPAQTPSLAPCCLRNETSVLSLKTFCELDCLASPLSNAYCGSSLSHFPKPAGPFHTSVPSLILFLLLGMPFLSLLSNSYSSFKTQLQCHGLLVHGDSSSLCASLASVSHFYHSAYEQTIYVFKRLPLDLSTLKEDPNFISPSITSTGQEPSKYWLNE